MFAQVILQIHDYFNLFVSINAFMGWITTESAKNKYFIPTRVVSLLYCVVCFDPDQDQPFYQSKTENMG